MANGRQGQGDRLRAGAKDADQKRAGRRAGAPQQSCPEIAEVSDELDCGEISTYGEQKNKTGKGKYDRDHIPSKAALKERARQLNGNRDLTPEEAAAIENGALSVAIPKPAHQQVSPTYGGRNTPEQVNEDAEDLAKAAKRDTDEMLEELDNHADPDCVKAYQKAADQIKLLTNDDYDTFLLFMLESVH